MLVVAGLGLFVLDAAVFGDGNGFGDDLGDGSLEVDFDVRLTDPSRLI